MVRAIAAIGVVGALLLGAPTAGAAEEARERRLYAMLGANASQPAFDLPSLAGQQMSWGIDARAGFRVHERIALEGNYLWAARHETTFGGQRLDLVEMHAGTANAKLFLLTGTIEPYALIGTGLVFADSDVEGENTRWAIRGGGGVQVFFTDMVGAYVEGTFLQPFGDLNDFATVPVTFGGIVRF